jgi:hypothetical protein
MKAENTGRQKKILISRTRLTAAKQWIKQNEEEILEWDFFEQNRQIDIHIAS